MGREIRRVPEDWEHPRNDNGHHIPLYDRTWTEILLDHIKYDLPYYLKHPWYIYEWFRDMPSFKRARPRWKKGSDIHYQIYETVSEGTPVSPVFATEEEIVEWLVKQGHSRHASEEFVKNKWVMSMAFTPYGSAMNIDIYDLPSGEI